MRALSHWKVALPVSKGSLMVMPFILSAAGLVVLLLAGDSLVKGAVNLSLRLGVPALIVSMIIVGFGTSSPELLVSIQSVLDGKPGLALGNVVGSNTANVLLVLGIPALLVGLRTSRSESRKSYVQMIIATLVFIALALRGVFDFWSGLILLAMLAYMLVDSVHAARRHRRDMKNAEPEEEIEGADPDMPWWKIFIFLAIGLVGLPLGANLLVTNASIIASYFGVSDAVIGLTLVALGTSLPELAATVVSAYRQHADVAIGNVIGSNMFNLVAIIGITAVIAPVPVDPKFLHFDLWVMLAASLLLIPFVFWKKDMGRAVGMVLSALYLLYIAIVLV